MISVICFLVMYIGKDAMHSLQRCYLLECYGFLQTLRPPALHYVPMIGGCVLLTRHYVLLGRRYIHLEGFCTSERMLVTSAGRLLQTCRTFENTLHTSE